MKKLWMLIFKVYLSFKLTLIEYLQKIKLRSKMNKKSSFFMKKNNSQ